MNKVHIGLEFWTFVVNHYDTIPHDVVKIARILISHGDFVMAVKVVRGMSDVKGLREAKCFCDALKHAMEGVIVGYTLADNVTSFELNGS